MWHVQETHKAFEDVRSEKHYQLGSKRTVMRWNERRLSDFQNSTGQTELADSTTWLQILGTLQEKGRMTVRCHCRPRRQGHQGPRGWDHCRPRGQGSLGPRGCIESWRIILRLEIENEICLVRFWLSWDQWPLYSFHFFLFGVGMSIL